MKHQVQVSQHPLNVGAPAACPPYSAISGGFCASPWELCFLVAPCLQWRTGRRSGRPGTSTWLKGRFRGFTTGFFVGPLLSPMHVGCCRSKVPLPGKHWC